MGALVGIPDGPLGFLVQPSLSDAEPLLDLVPNDRRTRMCSRLLQVVYEVSSVLEFVWRRTCVPYEATTPELLLGLEKVLPKREILPRGVIGDFGAPLAKARYLLESLCLVDSRFSGTARAGTLRTRQPAGKGGARTP